MKWQQRNTVLLVTFFTWVFIGIDRMVIAYLMPWIIPEFDLNYTEVGMIMSVLGLTWAVAALFGGPLSDKYGKRKVVIPGVLVFSILGWMSGVVRSLTQMLVVRGLLGVGEGLTFPGISSHIVEVAPPERRGVYSGIFGCGFPVGATFIAPVYATTMANALSWRWAFTLTLIPGLLITFAYWKWIKEPPSTAARAAARARGEDDTLRDEHGNKVTALSVLRYRNVIVIALVTIASMMWLYSMTSFALLYLTDAVGMPVISAGLAVTGYGIGGAVGQLFMPIISDFIGRRATLVIGNVIAGVLCVILGLTAVGPALAFVMLLAAGIFGWGQFALQTNLVPFEAVPLGLGGAAIAIPIFAGEVIGGAVFPVIQGRLGDAFGLGRVIVIAGIICLVAALLSAVLKETAPRFLKKKEPVAIMEASQ